MVPFGWALRVFCYLKMLLAISKNLIPGFWAVWSSGKRGWVKFGLVLCIIYKLCLSVNTEDYVLWRLTFLMLSGEREGCIWEFWWSEESLWVTRLHWLRQDFLKIQKVASRSSTCRVLKNAKRLNICILWNTPICEQTLSNNQYL